MTEYPDLYALLTDQAVPRPSVESIEALAARIQRDHPGATHAVLFRNGHWTVLPVGPGCPIRTIAEVGRRVLAKTNGTAPRRPVAYCHLKVKGV